MLNIAIEDKLKYIPNFLGVFSRDTLPVIKNYPCSLIANFDEHDDPGTHWIAIYIDVNGYGEYFDPYGLEVIHNEFKRYLHQNTVQYERNKIPLQCDECVTCGEYCSAYIILRSCCFSLSEFHKLFRSNRYTNDFIIKSIFNIL